MNSESIVRRYEDFELELDPERADSSENVIVQYGFPGSGSTYMWQVLNAIFPGAKKTHNCPSYSEAVRVVATVRDFRDVLCTYLGRANLPANRDSIDFLINLHASDARSFRDLYRVSEVWGDRQNILWLRYEDFFGNFDYLITRIEEFFGVSVPEEKRRAIEAEYSLDANLRRTAQADALCQKDGAKGWLDRDWRPFTVDGINGLHITGNGAVGKWKRIIPEELHDYVTDLLAAPLKQYGYL